MAINAFADAHCSTVGDHEAVMWDDGWTAVTRDRKRTAQFEHTLLVTEDGVEVLTRL